MSLRVEYLFADNEDDLSLRARRLNRVLSPLTPGERLARLRRAVAGNIVFVTGFGIEGQAIVHLIARHSLDIDVVTIDTGRLFPETYDLWAETERRYGRRIPGFYPSQEYLEILTARQGINGFRDSRRNRFACCYVRKAEPLDRALTNAEAWIAEPRGEPSGHGQSAGIVTADLERGMLKVNPFFDWTRDTVLEFIAANDIPVHPLNGKGYMFVGCAPCTPAIDLVR